MARSQYQVLVIPYFLDREQPVYGVFRRRDMGLWQFISGGGEDTAGGYGGNGPLRGFLSTGHLL